MPPHRTPSPPRRLARLFAALLLSAAAGAPFAQDASGDSVAFEMLLALPQHLPEGEDFPSRQDGSITDEATLQEQLASALAAGADVNAYRYGGTLLHHALRGGLQDTALWLLAHGANPALEVTDLPDGKPDGHDALQLAIVYRRWRVVDALLRRPALAPRTARDLAFRWAGVFDVHADPATADEAGRELARRLAWPGGWQGGCLVDAAAAQAVLPMLEKAAGTAGARIARDESKPLAGRDLVVAGNCVPPAVAFAGIGDERIGAPLPATGRFAKLPATELARLDAHLAQPLLPALATLLETSADAQAWSTLPLRRPWQDTAFARAVVQALLRTPMKPEVRDAALRSVPPEALRAALDDDATLHAWFDRLAHQPLPQAMATLAAIDGATLQRHAEAAITGLASDPMDDASHVPYAQKPQKASGTLWIALLSRLPAPIALRTGLPILTIAPDSSWPTLFARGYVPAPVRVEDVWVQSSPSDWRDRWPGLQAAVGPQGATAVVKDMIAGWTAPCDADYCAPRPGDAEKLQVVLAAGVRPPPAVTLSLGAARRVPAKTLQALAATHLVMLPPGDVALSVAAAAPPPDVAPTGRFALAPLACSPKPGDAIVRAAIRAKFLAGGDTATPMPNAEPQQPESFQPLDDPGAHACAWLVTGGYVGSRMSFDDDDFYIGRSHLTPCGEATLYGEVWRDVDGRVVATQMDEGAQEGALPLAGAGGARRFVLTLPFRGGTCDAGRPAKLYEWTGEAAARHLVQRSDDGASWQAFAAQCNVDDVGPCFGLPGQDDAPAPADAPPSPYAPLSRDDFVVRFGEPLRERWLAAFLAGDVGALRSADLADPAPAWRVQALAALTDSTLPLDQRRRRIAWMFRDKLGMAASFGGNRGVWSEVVGLVAWLPREDWRPMLVALDGDPGMLKALQDAATAKGDAGLACTFTQAMGGKCEARR